MVFRFDLFTDLLELASPVDRLSLGISLHYFNLFLNALLRHYFLLYGTQNDFDY